MCGTHAGRNALASAPASSPRAGARAVPRTHVSQSEAPSRGGTAVTHEGDDEEGEEEPPQVFGPVCSYQECYAKCTNRCTLIEMFQVRGGHTVHLDFKCSALWEIYAILRASARSSCVIVRAQPPAKKSVTVHLLVVFRSGEEVVEKG